MYIKYNITSYLNDIVLRISGTKKKKKSFQSNIGSDLNLSNTLRLNNLRVWDILNRIRWPTEVKMSNLSLSLKPKHVKKKTDKIDVHQEMRIKAFISSHLSGSIFAVAYFRHFCFHISINFFLYFKGKVINLALIT